MGEARGRLGDAVVSIDEGGIVHSGMQQTEDELGQERQQQGFDKVPA